MSETPSSLEVCHLPILRVSAASFADIRYGDKRALTINKNRLSKGERVLTPIGGAIELTLQGMKEVRQLLEIDETAFEKGNDLRLLMAGKNVNKLCQWFLRRENREITPEREFREELIEELGLFTPADFAGISFQLLGFQTELAETGRVGREGRLTLRLIEIHNTQLTEVVLDKLVQETEKPKAMIKFVSGDEIVRGVSSEGIEIGSVARLLLEPGNDIPAFK